MKVRSREIVEKNLRFTRDIPQFISENPNALDENRAASREKEKYTEMVEAIMINNHKLERLFFFEGKTIAIGNWFFISQCEVNIETTN